MMSSLTNVIVSRGLNCALALLTFSASSTLPLLKKCMFITPASLSDWSFVIKILTMDRPDELPFRDTFLPYYYGKHLRANMKPVAA